jgi:hypothetical protein
MRRKVCLRLAVGALFAGLVLLPPLSVLATSVDHLSLCNLEGYPGDIVKTEITLSGTEVAERSGFWETYYKQMDGDDDRMDITPWISIDPNEYVIRQGESILFNVTIAIPQDASPGLWGAISEDAGETGHSDERRTYLIFKDTVSGGNVYSGLLIPVSVKVLGKPNPAAPLIDFVRGNIAITVLIIVVIVLAAVLFRKRRRAKVG